MNQNKNSSRVSIEFCEEIFSGLQFCPDFLVIYGLRGSSAAAVGSERYPLEKGGLLTIPPFQRHEMRCEEGAGLAILHIPQDVLWIADAYEKTAAVHCYVRGSASGNQKKYDPVRIHFAHIFQNCFAVTPQADLLILSYVSQLLSVLTGQFLVADASKRARNDLVTFERCSRIMQYIHENCQGDISIEKLAGMEYVSVGYLSRFFRQNMGTTFTEYLTELRLRHAVRDLRNSENTITQIALENGFKNVNSFIHYFKQVYGMTPGQYRVSGSAAEPENRREERDLPRADGVRDLLEYATREEARSAVPALPAEQRSVKVDAAKRGHLLRHTWRRLLNIGYAREGLLAEVQEQMRKAQREIGFEYVRFHGIFDDDMHVYFEDEHGRVYMDYSRTDLVLDFVLSIGLKPYVELGYMPGKLAKNSSGLFDRFTHISVFRSEANWLSLVRGFVQHCMERYGHRSVLEWRFTTIDLNSAAAELISFEEYLQLYHVTYNCVKQIDRRFMFGGPGGFVFNIFSGKYVHRYLAYVTEHDCVPDFICTQCFPHDKIDLRDNFWQYTMSQSLSPAHLSTDVHYMKHTLEAYRTLLCQFELADLPVWVEQWNSTVWQRDLSGDTCYKAAWLAMNICENYDDPEAFGYWSVSDYMDEISDFGGVYHGGYGLFTYNGIPKSGWHALRLLRMLGDYKLGSGEGWMAVKSEQGIQILLYHYCHYDYLYCRRYRRLTDPQKAYTVFPESGPVNYHIRISHLSEGTYEIRRQTITPAHGSSFDTWVSMGRPPYLNAEERTYLERVSQPLYQVETVRIFGDYALESTLNAHEVQIITIRYANL